MVDELKDIAQFVEVARAKSFIKAAQKLDIPASTLSRRISELELAIGSKLFNRTTRRVEMTPEGLHYYSRCKQIVEAAKTAREELRDLAENPRGLLRMTMSPDFGTTYLSPIIAGFSRLYPEISLQIDLSPRRVDIIGEGFDLALRIGIPDEPYLVTKRLLTARRGIFASPSFLEQNPAPLLPADIAKLACITIDCPDGVESWTLRQGINTQEIEVRGPITVNNPRLVLQLAVEGMGLAVADKVIASQFVKAGQLVSVLPEWELAPIMVYAVTPSHDLSARTRVFVDYLQKKLKTYEL